MERFGARLQQATGRRGPLCVGIDPHPSLLGAWGLPDDAGGLAAFCETVVDALAEEVAVLKPQSAFFERHGAAGIAVLEQTVRAARSAGAIVLLDVKRGDIGSTAQAYADAYLLAAAPLSVDAITVNPYLGFESLRPFLDTAREHGGGVFVLGLTSNPSEGTGLQHARVAGADSGTGDPSTGGPSTGDPSISAAAAVLASVRAENAVAGAAVGSVGVVVGATLSEVDLASAGIGGAGLDVGGPVLAPGLGAQGGTAADVSRIFGSVIEQVLPSTSRDVLSAGPDPAALRSAALWQRDVLLEAFRV
ncbi:MAG: orotidine-5'-phosphate decarboxylase [Nocardioidaceae bacterium]|nr:orotidine-5'-phosphate decarboxylase [Nocardioidaceae bacterium]